MTMNPVTNYATNYATQAAQQQTQSGVLGGSSSTDDLTQTFLTLLMTELKAQDPSSPMDPNQMVGQLVQFNTLGEIMKIRELVQAMPTTSATGGK